MISSPLISSTNYMMDKTLKVNERNHAFDLTRAVCVLWIVAFWHLQDYINVNDCPKESKFPEMTAMVCYDITICVFSLLYFPFWLFPK